MLQNIFNLFSIVGLLITFGSMTADEGIQFSSRGPWKSVDANTESLEPASVRGQTNKVNKEIAFSPLTKLPLSYQTRVFPNESYRVPNLIGEQEVETTESVVKRHHQNDFVKILNLINTELGNKRKSSTRGQGKRKWKFDPAFKIMGLGKRKDSQELQDDDSYASSEKNEVGDDSTTALQNPKLDIKISADEKRVQNFDPAMKYMGLGKKSKYDPAMRFMGLGKKSNKYDPAMRFMGLGKRTETFDPEIRYMGPGKNSEKYKSAIRFMGKNNGENNAIVQHMGLEVKNEEYDPTKWYLSVGKKDGKFDPAIRFMGLGKKTGNFDPAMRYMGLGKRERYDPAIRYMGLGKRSGKYDPAMRYMGLGKRERYDPAIRYMGLGKRSGKYDPAMRYMGLGKRGRYDPAIRYMGLGKKGGEYDPENLFTELEKKSEKYNPAIRYVGLGKKAGKYDPAIRYMGLGKKAIKYDPAIRFMGLGKKGQRYDPALRIMGLGKRDMIQFDPQFVEPEENSNQLDEYAKKENNHLHKNIINEESEKRADSKYRNSLKLIGLGKRYKSSDYVGDNSYEHLDTDIEDFLRSEFIKNKALGKRDLTYNPSLKHIGLGKRKSSNDSFALLYEYERNQDKPTEIIKGQHQPLLDKENSDNHRIYNEISHDSKSHRIQKRDVMSGSDRYLKNSDEHDMQKKPELTPYELIDEPEILLALKNICFTMFQEHLQTSLIGKSFSPSESLLEDEMHRLSRPPSSFTSFDQPDTLLDEISDILENNKRDDGRPKFNPGWKFIGLGKRNSLSDDIELFPKMYFVPCSKFYPLFDSYAQYQSGNIENRENLYNNSNTDTNLKNETPFRSGSRINNFESLIYKRAATSQDNNHPNPSNTATDAMFSPILKQQ